MCGEPPEVEFERLEDVRAEVERSARDLITADDGGGNGHGWAVRAVDTEGKVISSTTFEEARSKLEEEGRVVPPPAPF